MAWNQNELSFIGINPDYDKDFFKRKSIVLWDIEQKKQIKLIDDLQLSIQLHGTNTIS